MTTPRLSIGLPVWNGENFLAESIDSILTQEGVDFELIISDNASSDRTPEICAHYAARDKRVRYHRQPANRGCAWNYNHVFSLASAPLFKWQAHDDVCLPGMFRRCVDALERAPESVVLAHTRTEIVDARRQSLTACYLPESLDLRDPRPHRRLARLLRHVTMGRAQFGVIRSSALRRTRLYERMIAADFVLLAELAMLGEFHELPEVLFQRRLHETISTRANRNEDALIRWWDPSQRHYRHLLPPMLRLGPVFLRSIRRLPLRPAERLRCGAVALWVWHARELRNTVGRWRNRRYSRVTEEPDPPRPGTRTATNPF